jgi:putative transposase
MKPSKYTEERISGILKERQGGMKVADLIRKYAVSEQPIYRWQVRYGGMTVCETKRSRQLEEENTRLKRMVAEFSLDKQMLEDVLSKKW